MKMPLELSADPSLRAENAKLRARLDEAEELLRAIRVGEVDALVVEGEAGPQIYTLQGLDAESSRFRGEMLAQVSDVVIAVDTEERVTFLNAAAARQYGVRASDVLGRKLTEIFTRHWPSQEEEAAAWAALREHGAWHGEYVQRTQQGHEVHVDSSFSALRDAHGVINGHLSVIRDITERKRAEAAQDQNMALFSKIIEQAPGGVYVVDAQFRVVQVNAEALPAFVSVQPLIGRDFDEVMEILWGPEIGSQCAAIFRHTLATGERYVSPRFSEQRHDIGAEQAYEWETQRITLPDGQHGVVCYFQNVTAREQAETARRVANERLTLAVKCSQVVLFQQDLDLRYTWLQNPKPGFERPDAIGKRDADLMERAEDATVTEALKREVIRTGIGLQQEVRVQIQGVIRHYDLLVEPQRDAAGLISGVTCAAIDITERKRGEEDLFEQRQLYKSVTDNAGVSLFIMDERQQCVFMNPAAEELTGFTREEVRGKALHDVIHHTRPDGSPYPLCECPIDQAFPQNDREQGEEVFVHKDGHFYHVAFTASPINDRQGKPVGTVIEVEDITERKRAEQALAERTELLNGVLEGTTDVIYVKDLDGRLLLANAAFAAAARSSPEQLVGKTDEEWFPPDVAAAVRQQDAAVIAGGSPMQFEDTLPVAGEARVFLTLKAPLRDGGGRILGILGISRDITERKRAEQNLVLLADVNEDLAGLETVEEIIRIVGAKIGSHFQLSICNFVALHEDAGELEVIHDWHRDDVPSTVGVYKQADYLNEEFEKTCRAGELFIVRDTDTDPRVERERYVPLQIRSFVLVPLVQDGVWKFLSNCYDSVPRNWREDEIQLMRELANRIWTRVERIRATELLRESEERLQLAIAGSDLGTWHWDIRTGVLDWSERCLKIFGIPPRTAMSYEKFLGTLHPEDRARADDAVQRALQDRSDYRIEFRSVWPDGSVHWAISLGRAYYDAAGEPTRMEGITLDITERKAAEETLRESEERLQKAISVQNVGVLFFKLDGQMLDANGALERMSGYTAEELHSITDWAQLTPPEFMDVTRRAAAELAEHGVTAPYEKQWIRKDGSRFWGLFSPTRLSGSGSESECVEFIIDITETKRAEEQLRLHRQLLETMVNHLPAAVALIRGSDLTFQMVNPSYQAISPGKQMVGKTIAEVWPETHPLFGQRCLHVLETGEPFEANDERYEIHRDSDGPLETAYFSSSMRRIHLPNEVEPGLLLTIWETTARKQTELALAERTALLSGVLEGTTDVIFVKDLNGRMLLANAAFAAAAGSTPEQLVGKTDEDWFPPDVAAAVRQQDEAVIAGGSPMQFEETLPVAGEARVFLTLKAPLRDGSNRIVGILGISRDITERHRAATALQESEARFRAAVNAVTSIIWTNNARGEMEGEQLGWGNFTGQTYQEYQGYGWAKAVHPDDAPPTIDAWNQAVAEMRTFSFEHRVRRNDGEWRVCSIRAVPVLGEAGKILEWVGVHTDITERKHAEETMARLAAVVESSHDALFGEDLDGIITSWNPGAEQIFGYRADEIVGTSILRLIPKAWQDEEHELQRKLAAGDAGGTFESIRRAKDGREFYASITISPLKDADGKVIGTSRVVRDITEREQAESLLRASEERMRLATAATGVGIWERNVITNAIRWDAQMFRIYGVPPTADGLVTYETWSRAVLPEDLAHQEEVLADTVRRLGNSSREFRILRADNGECRWIQSVETVRANEEGKAEWVIGTNLDGTARKNAERAIREEAQRKDEFLAMLGHELRNPLNAIRNAVQIGLEAPQDRDACQWASSVIDRQSQQLSRMVDDLLDVARINRGRIELRVAALDLGPVLEQAIAVVRPLLARRRQTFTSDIGSQLRVTGDAPRLQQVFVNLLTNAVKYTPDNGRISLHARNEDGEVVVAIADSGAGISAELLPHIFDLFRQADSTLDRALGGLGIGLSVVKSLVEMHFGQVRVESAGTNAGATATVRLPALLDWPAAESPPAAHVIDTAPPRPVRVLIVDDHIDAAESLETLLQRRGCEARRAHSGPAGVAAARDFNPEVLLLDLGLPGFDGYEVARILRAEAPFTDALFIAISGYAQDGDRQRCLASGFDDHFPKPLDLKKLLQVIHSRPDQAPVTQRHFPPCAPAAGPP